MAFVSQDVAEEPLVSVIIPFFNRIDLVVRAIESVVSQNYSHIQVILINDGSTDDDSVLSEFLREYDYLEYVRLPENKGPSSARNEGIKRSKGKYIAFLDSDDAWCENKLKIQVCEMSRNGWLFSHTSYYAVRFGSVKYVKSGRWNYRFPLPVFTCKIATPTVMINREALGDIFFRPEFRYGEDVLLWNDLAKITTLVGIDLPLSKVFLGESNASLNREIQKQVFVILGEHGLIGRPWLQFFHRLYRHVRNSIR